MRDAGPQKWVFEEIKDLGNMNFEFQNKGDALNECVSTSSKMPLFDDANVHKFLKQKYVIEDFAEEKIK